MSAIVLQSQTYFDSWVASVPGPFQGVVRSICSPFEEAIEMIAGDPDLLVDDATAWLAVSAQVREVAEDQLRSRQALAGSWVADGQASFDQRLEELEQALEQLAVATDEASGLLVQTAEAAVEGVNFILDLVQALLLMLLADFIAAVALSVVSFGASVAAGAASAFAKAAVTMSRVAQVVARLERFFLSAARVMRNVAEFFAIWKEIILAMRALKRSAGLLTLPGLGWGAAGAAARSPVMVTTGLGALGNLVDAFRDYDPPSVGP